ncbi:MAG: hypothetical protein HY907_06055 [Deltaproteobacteria bacterium]|nr:hypothetical protein [Deltaproteobacteria bacterium]
MTTMTPADRPENPEIGSATVHDSDDEYDFGPRIHAGAMDSTARWRMANVERDRSFRLDVLRAAGLLG